MGSAPVFRLEPASLITNATSVQLSAVDNGSDQCFNMGWVQAVPCAGMFVFAVATVASQLLLDAWAASITKQPPPDLPPPLPAWVAGPIVLAVAAVLVCAPVFGLGYTSVLQVKDPRSPTSLQIFS